MAMIESANSEQEENSILLLILKKAMSQGMLRGEKTTVLSIEKC